MRPIAEATELMDAPMMDDRPTSQDDLASSIG